MKFFRSKKKEEQEDSHNSEGQFDDQYSDQPESTQEPELDVPDYILEAAQKDAAAGGSLFGRLSKSRNAFSGGLFGFLKTASVLDDDFFEDLEDQLVLSDLGADTSEEMVIRLRDDVRKYDLKTADQLVQELQAYMVDMLSFEPVDTFLGNSDGPHVVLMVGVNGVGKTTTVAKLAKLYQDRGLSVMMAACDTFRAAAIEQLESWGEKLAIPVIAQAHGSDAAAVAFDAYSAACARGADVLLIDTAGRQHTHGDLMEQLKKVKRVLEKTGKGVPHEILLTVDAGNGQNIHSQVESFSEAVNISGLCVTKLDGTAKGGVVISIVRRFGIPVQYLGVGEKATDLRPFIVEEFVDALLPDFSSEEGN